MKNKKILYLEDLIKFCENQQLTTFSSKESGYQLCVQVPATFKKKEVKTEVEDNTLLYCILKTCHIGLNRNGSYISEESMKAAMPTLKYKPILCNFTDTEDGKDFTSHDMEIDDDGNINYIERQVGCFTADEPYLEYDEEKDKTYVMAYAAIPRDYTEAADIIERKDGTKVSVELSINEMSFNSKEKYLQLDSFVFSGCTLLGVDPDTGKEVGEGMEGARLDIADFSKENNSIFANHTSDLNNKLIETLEKLDATLSNISKFNINDSKESIETYGKEDIEVENQEILVNEEITEIEEFTEEVVTNSEETDEVTETEEIEVIEEVEETVEESTEEEEAEAEESETPAEDETPEVVEEFEEDVEVEIETEQFSEKLVRTYEISHDDVRYALYNLLSVQEEADNDWYFINAVYDNYFTYENWTGDKIYGQSYVKENDNVSFDGERWNLHRELLTDSEYAELMSMRSNYAALEQFKLDTEKAQLHAQREEILNNEKYSVLAEKDENNEYKNEAYAKLVSEMDNYSLTDLEKELKSVFADYITNGGQFAYSGEPEVKHVVNKKMFAAPTSKKSSRYGNLFNK